MELSIDDAVQEGGEAAAEGAMWAHLLPAAKRPPTLPALEQLLLVPDAPDAGGSLDACQQQVRRLLPMRCGVHTSQLPALHKCV